MLKKDYCEFLHFFAAFDCTNIGTKKNMYKKFNKNVKHLAPLEQNSLLDLGLLCKGWNTFNSRSGL